VRWLAAAGSAAGTTGQMAESLEQRVTEFTLPNGLHFITLRRTAAPIVSCHTYANIGAYDEEEGQTGARRPLAWCTAWQACRFAAAASAVAGGAACSAAQAAACMPAARGL
jgi:hypothetical protein